MRSSADCSETSAIMSLLNLLLAPSNLDISDLKIDISERSRSTGEYFTRIRAPPLGKKSAVGKSWVENPQN